VSRGGGFGGDTTSGPESGSRAVPYVCPFCGEEDLRPAESSSGGPPRWHCRSCLRLFSLTFHGLAAPEASSLPSTLPSDAE
jgi:transposase-like protein